MTQPHLHAVERELLEAGFRRVYQPAQEVISTPTMANGKSRLAKLKKGDRVTPRQVRIHRQVISHAGLTEAALVHAMQFHGIGRPSTYASTIATLLERGYAVRDEQGVLASTALGCQVCDFLTRRFPDLFALDFTARMESQLDALANGKATYEEVIQSFWLKLITQLEK